MSKGASLSIDSMLIFSEIYKYSNVNAALPLWLCEALISLLLKDQSDHSTNIVDMLCISGKSSCSIISVELVFYSKVTCCELLQ